MSSLQDSAATNLTTTDSGSTVVRVDSVVRQPRHRVTRPAVDSLVATQHRDTVPLPAADSSTIYQISYRPDSADGSNAAGRSQIAAPHYTEFYYGHELKPIHHLPQKKNNISPGWLFPLLIIVIAVYAGLRVFYNKFFKQMISAFINNNIANQIVRDENLLVQRVSVYLSMMFNMIGAMYLSLVSIRVGWGLGGIGFGFSRFLFFAILVSAVYALKFLILKICGWVFGLDREMAIYTFNIFLINNILGIILIPIITLMAYNPFISSNLLIIISLVFASSAYLYRLIRGLLAGISVSGYSSPYLFLYLCTLEIAPLLVLIRVIIH